MSKKSKQLFKEKLLQNKVNAEKKYNEFKAKSVVTVEVEENFIAKVDRGDLFISQEEIKDIVKDIFYVGVDLKENSIIDLDAYCDVCYKMMYRGKNNNEVIFSLC